MIARKSLLILLTNLLGAVAGLATLFFVGRYLTPESVGMVAYALSLAGLGTFLAQFGFDFAHVKRVSERRHLGDCLTTYATIKLLLTSLFVVVAATAAFAWDATRGLDDTTLPIVLLAILYHAFLQLRSIPMGTFNGLLRTAKAQSLNLVEFLVRAPLVALVALYAGAHQGFRVPFADAVHALGSLLPEPSDDATRGLLLGLGYAAAAFASLMLGLFLLWRGRYPLGRFDPDLARSYRAYALPLALFSILSLLATQIDTVMIGYFWSPTQVGLYFAAQRLASVVLIIPTAVTTLFFPQISALASRGDEAGVHRASVSAQRYLSLVMLLAAVNLILFPREGIHIFVGDQFLRAAPILTLLALNAVLIAFGAVPSAILMGHDRSRAVATIGLASVGANIALNTLLIPSSILGVPLAGLGAFGAALATVIAQAISTLVLTLAARRVTGRIPVGLAILKHVTAALVTALLMNWMRSSPLLGGLDRVWELLMAGAIAAAVYLSLLVLWGELRRRDLRFLGDLVHPGRMARYVVDEVRSRHR